MHRVLLTLPPCLALLLVLVGLPSPPVGADELTARSHIDARTRQAVESGLRYLKRTQNADGSWSSNAGKKINETYAVFENGADVPHVGITSLAILAYLAGGHLPGRGPYGETLDRAVDFVLDQVQPGGFIASNKTRMYSHAFATLALAELYGVTRTQLVRQKLQEAVEFTVKCQNETGGWRYVPFTKDSDMSVTVCQVVALRAARNAGIRVPRATINRALHYVITSANDGSDPRYPAGSFLYQPETQHFNRDSYALCAAGLTTMFQAGLYDDAEPREVHGGSRHPEASRAEDPYVHRLHAEAVRPRRDTRVPSPLLLLLRQLLRRAGDVPGRWTRPRDLGEAGSDAYTTTSWPRRSSGRIRIRPAARAGG